jgi:hypothetical protein
MRKHPARLTTTPLDEEVAPWLMPDGTHRDIAIRAARQIEGLFNALLGCAIPSVLADKDPIHVTAVLRAFALRGDVLARATVRALGDASASPEDLQDIVDCG